MKKLLSLLIVSFFTTVLFAQTDTLPKFSVKKKEGVISISWINAFKNASQINVQRSKDSNRNFVTIHSTPNPNAKTYTYKDLTAKNDSGYYRVFILFEGSNYIFTKPQRAVIVPDEIIKKENKPVGAKQTADSVNAVELGTTDPANLKNGKQKESKIPGPPPLPVKKAWEPSVYIFTGDDGNVVIKLPDAGTKKYSITFSREEGRPIFVLPEVKETFLTLDKASFLKSGWYYFELRENGTVKERNKFLITRDN
jgi:hypothetical protein